MKVFTVQGTLDGVRSNDPRLPARIAEALRLHGAEDPAVVLYEEDEEVGLVFQWAGPSSLEVTGEVAETIECLIAALLEPGVQAGRWFVDEEGDLPTSWASALKRLASRLPRGRRHHDLCLCSVRKRSRSTRWFASCPPVPHGLA